MFKFLMLLGQGLMGFSVLFIILKLGSISEAFGILVLGLIITIFSKKNIQK